jgi:hypothetical protein
MLNVSLKPLVLALLATVVVADDLAATTAAAGARRPAYTSGRR